MSNPEDNDCPSPPRPLSDQQKALETLHRLRRKPQSARVREPVTPPPLPPLPVQAPIPPPPPPDAAVTDDAPSPPRARSIFSIMSGRPVAPPPRQTPRRRLEQVAPPSRPAPSKPETPMVETPPSEARGRQLATPPPVVLPRHVEELAPEVSSSQSETLPPAVCSPETAEPAAPVRGRQVATPPRDAPRRQQVTSPPTALRRPEVCAPRPLWDPNFRRAHARKENENDSGKFLQVITTTTAYLKSTKLVGTYCVIPHYPLTVLWITQTPW